MWLAMMKAVAVTALGCRKVLFSELGGDLRWGLPMNIVLMVAILAISSTSLYAQDQPDTAKLKADAENVVKIISGDKRKIATYCEFADLGDQIDEAKDSQDTEKAEELSQKVDELGRKLGPEFVALADALKNTDPNSEDGKEIGSIFDKLDKLCGV